MKMSYNDYMHPRNPFKVKPDYKVLGEKYPTFKEYLVAFPSNNNKFKIDFKNSNALRCLTTVLLKEKFDLDVNIPLDRLIPCIPQRMNYILWVEDLINKCLPNDETNEKRLSLIDCGTGSSCVFPLISAKMNSNWHFLATELDDVSMEYARQNCESNNLANRITVIKGDSDRLIPDHPDQFVALMCNPPFFESRSEDCGSSLSNTSALVESTVEGGEESFVSKLIEESLMHKKRIKFYTVMLGRKSSFKNLRKKLQSYNDALNYVCTEFFQGRTIRWGLCWTFDLSLNLNLIYKTNQKPNKRKNPIFIHEIPESKFVYTYSLNVVTNHILELLSDIHIIQAHLSSTKKSGQKIEFNIKTNLNTWSHQRRKRRLAKQQYSSENDHTPDKLDDEMQDSNVNRKRMFGDLESSFESLDIAHSINQPSSDEHWKKARFSETTNECNDFYLLNCVMIIQEEKEKIYLKMTANEKVKDRDSVHQLFQYLKNNL